MYIKLISQSVQMYLCIILYVVVVYLSFLRIMNYEIFTSFRKSTQSYPAPHCCKNILQTSQIRICKSTFIRKSLYVKSVTSVMCTFAKRKLLARNAYFLSATILIKRKCPMLPQNFETLFITKVWRKIFLFKEHLARCNFIVI